MYDKLQAFLAQKGLAVDETKLAARQTIIDNLRQAREDNKVYLALANPTAAERNKQVEKLTRQNNRMMRLLLNDLTGDD